MFGLFRPKAERLALKLERLLMTQEAAYEKRNWSVFIYAGQQVLPVMRELHVGTDWDDAKLEAFLKSRGLAKSVCDENYRERMMRAQEEAGAFY